jgi:dihydrofolate reductase
MPVLFCATLLLMISIVVAADKNGVIGKDNRIPWRIRDDFVYLRNLTKGHTVILGRKTYESMVWYYDRSGKKMPGSMYIVVSSEFEYVPARENATSVRSIPEALKKAEELGDDQILAIGGGGIFKGILEYTDRIYLTEVQAEVDGDTYFPELDPKTWHETSREHHSKDDRNDYDFDWVVLERV